ncbi:protein translocase subunit secG [Halospina denitrificans]|uniref:Protein-export membrane protein SecG n=1 Tax=Halospina denitrificans TaxID=332522 RepID=A0A4V3EQV6_9GAMM|nr:preprotein translocase subunit SecG [Halospina denitrificans]TDT43568.1 protein translocase subunit secG [Halospina denitrificans]
MNWVESAILLAHVLIALALVVLILLQRGKGADAGAAFGGGSSQTVFGSAGGVGFMVKLTAVLAALFFVTSFSLAMYAKQRAEVGAQAGVPMVEEQSGAQEQASGDAAQGEEGATSEDSEGGDDQASESDADQDGEELPEIE